MDDFNHMMEYQSEMMTDVSPTIECVETQQQQEQQQQLELDELCTPPELTDPSSNKNTFIDESQTHVDGQSVSDNVDENLTLAKDDAHESVHVDGDGDKCAVELKECENTGSATVAGDEIKKQDKIPETEKLAETDDGNAVKGDDGNESDDDGNGNGKGDDNDDREHKENDEQDESNEQNASGTNVKSKKDDELDLNQCRICMTKDNLLDIFRIGEKTSFRICDLIMKLAPSVKINERDYLPHSICGNCVDRIEAAYELRVQCEETDKTLRSKLKRSKKTRRAPSEFVLLDCVESSSDSDDDQKSDDDEFQLSEESEESSDSDSDSSYDEKKKRLPSFRGRRRGQASQPLKRTIPPTVTITPQPLKKSRNNSVVYIKAANSDDDDDSGVATKNRQSVKAPMLANRLQYRCDVCNRPFSTADALAQHRKSHPDQKCTICAMSFKLRSALHQHMQRHRDDPDRVCSKCHRVFVSKAECQRHVQMAHLDTAVCEKCKRYFPNKSQLDAHKCNPVATAINSDQKPIETTSKRKNDTDTTVSGRDLFKSVAPLTTTYWSDSFSD